MLRWHFHQLCWSLHTDVQEIGVLHYYSKSIVVKPLALSCRCHMCGHDNWQYANTAIFCNFPSAWRLLFTKVAKLYNSQHFQSPSFKLRDQCDAGEVEVVIHSNWPIGSASMAPKLGLASLHNAIQKLLQKLIQMQIQTQIQIKMQIQIQWDLPQLGLASLQDLIISS